MDWDFLKDPEQREALLQTGLGVLPFVGTGLSALREVENDIAKGRIIDPEGARSIAWQRGIAGLGIDAAGFGLLAKGGKILKLAGVPLKIADKAQNTGGILALGVGLPTRLAGQNDIAGKILETADFLNPDTWVKKHLYAANPNADPAYKAQLDAQLAQTKNSPTNTLPNPTTAPTINQEPPTIGQIQLNQSAGFPPTSPSANTERLALEVDETSIDSLLAKARELQNALASSGKTVRYL